MTGLATAGRSASRVTRGGRCRAYCSKLAPNLRADFSICRRIA